MPLLADAEFTPIREALALFLVHSYTRQAYTTGTVDAHGNAVEVAAGSPVTGVACQFSLRQELINDAQGSRLVSLPVLKLAWDDPLAVGDRVSNVQDQTGAVLLDGPARVETVTASAGLGAVVERFATLRGSRTVI